MVLDELIEKMKCEEKLEITNEEYMISQYELSDYDELPSDIKQNNELYILEVDTQGPSGIIVIDATEKKLFRISDDNKAVDVPENKYYGFVQDIVNETYDNLIQDFLAIAIYEGPEAYKLRSREG
ncbi:MAG: hypothetical protein KKF89_02585 [Nanoarchaeota archaeon]|nr:hypothetical protein [Nanoarchaeota archaeon]